MGNLQWIFSGIGTEILTLLIGTVLGSFAGYKIGARKSYSQSQKANDGSKQKQELLDDDKSESTLSKESITKVNQYQKAGRNSEQSQIGRIKNGE